MSQKVALFGFPRFSIIVILALALLLGCEKKNTSPVGYGELDRDISEPISLLIDRPSEDTTYATLIPTGSSGSLLVGSFEGYETRALLRYQISDTQVTNSATIARLLLRVQRRVGDEPLEMDLCQVTRAWSEMGATWTHADSATPWDSGGTYDPDPLDSESMGAIDSIIFTIPNSRLSSVLDTTNCGLILVSRGNSVADFSSSGTSNPPLLLVYYLKGDSAKVDTSAPEADAFIIHSDYQIAGARLAAGSGHVFRTLLRFDLSPIPENATINYAMLGISVDTAQSYFEETQLQAYRVTGEWQGEDTPFSDEDTSGVAELSWPETWLEVDLAPLMQSCISEENFGLVLRSTSEVSDISRIVLFSSEADSTKWPNLRIFYTLRPGFRGE